MGDLGEEMMDLSPAIAPELNDLLDFVRQNSAFYRELWKNVPENGTAPLNSYPVVEYTSYWAANTSCRNEVLTGPHVSGIVLKTGGTTNDPKITFYSKDELRMASQQLGQGILAAGIRAYDRIASLFHAGEMYGSFLLHVLSIMGLTVPLVHLPIEGSSSCETTVQ